MKTYIVTVTEEVTYETEIEANSENEAIAKEMNQPECARYILEDKILNISAKEGKLE